MSRLPSPAASAWRIALAVALAHGVNDAYSAFLTPLLPRIMADLGLSITLAATLTVALGLGASVLQPVMGAVADRHGVRRFVIAGPVISAIFLSSIGLAGSFASLVCLLALGGLGSAVFHPPAASLAAYAGNGGSAGARMSLFSFGGALGYALGPLAAVGLVGAFGLGGLALAILPALLLIPLLLRLIPAGTGHAGTSHQRQSVAETLRSLRGPLGLLFGISAITAFVQRVFVTMLPIAVAADGGSEALGASTLSVYLAAQAVGSIAGGVLADRHDRRHVLVGLTAAAVPAHLLALALPAGGGHTLAVTAVAGLLNMALLPPLVVMAQEVAPRAAATSAGIIMGLAWAAGSVGMIGAGGLGDLLGARAAAMACMPALLAASLAALHPSLGPYRRATPTDAT